MKVEDLAVMVGATLEELGDPAFWAAQSEADALELYECIRHGQPLEELQAIQRQIDIALKERREARSPMESEK